MQYAVQAQALFARLLLGCVLSLAIACGNSNDGFWADASAASGGNPNDAAKTLADLSGSFDITLQDGAMPSVSFSGAVVSGAPPSQPWVLSRKDNGCVLYQERPDCKPACQAGLVCDDARKCVSAPAPQDVGALSLSGLGASAIAMSPSDGVYGLPSDAALQYPPCAAGSALQLQADGGRFGAFALATTCIAPLKFDSSISYTRGGPLTLTWGAGGGSSRIRAQVDLAGGNDTRNRIVCDVADSGSVEVAADMLELLLKLGATGLPAVTLTRIATGGAQNGEPRNITFTMQDSIRRAFAIPGLTCAANGDCASGKACVNQLCT